MTRNSMDAAEIVAALQASCGDVLHETRISEWGEGCKKTPGEYLWIRTGRGDLTRVLSAIIAIDFPHLSVVSGVDCGETVELLYHMSVFFGIKTKEVCITVTVALPKDDLTVPTISHLIPGAVYTEREKQEMLGITVVDIPDARGLFLPADFPEGVYPWRKDETGIREDMVKDLFAVGRPEDRPNPPVKPKEKPAKKQETPKEKPVKPEEKPEVKGEESNENPKGNPELSNEVTQDE
ncbi:hypothetical protein AZH53_04850 [Methanomicrobiaceae archaeon CYW5]|uniref:NADH-quinone oxidoreductase subunit C n=1 Tax=Methanovulcanius yangii TaxID=1789227 RepID=UPI0029CA0E9C|nr:NADH-quinone oxidoreductase subunit C [Methanovulcanius yangii]MBT8507745.1 hypothetical protein [Methanovulcanius yangii]